MKNSKFCYGFIIGLLFVGALYSQFLEKPTEPNEDQKPTFKPLDFSQYFNIYETGSGAEATRNSRLSHVPVEYQALDHVLDPEKYIIGPGDLFSLDIWSPLEQHIAVTVSPEGRLIIPTVGEVDGTNQSLKAIQSLVIDKALIFYKNCKIGFPLMIPRAFMVYVTGEVKNPGTYQANAATRISAVLSMAGGTSKYAWNQGVQVRHLNSRTDTVNIEAFETLGELKQNPYVFGGDVIFVPPMDPSSQTLVYVEGNVEHAGTYQILPREPLKAFLSRIRVFSTQIEIKYIRINRGGELEEKFISPFDGENEDFYLKNGDRIVLPANYVFVKGSVTAPGPYAFSHNLKAKDYAAMARWNGSIDGVSVLHVQTGKKEKGQNVEVQPGDIVSVPQTWAQRMRSSFTIIATLTSLILTAKAVGAL